MRVTLILQKLDKEWTRVWMIPTILVGQSCFNGCIAANADQSHVAWKLAYVLRGWADHSLLKTVSSLIYARAMGQWINCIPSSMNLNVGSMLNN